MDQESSFQNLMHQLASGENDAAQRIVERFMEQLVAAARQRLGSSLRPKVAPSDVAQSVFRLFFARQLSDPYSIDNWEALWGLLLGITLGKCRNLHRHYHQQIRDVSRETALEQDDDLPGNDWAGFDRAPSATECAILEETWEAMLRDMDDRACEIARLRLEGFSPGEISDTLNCSERTVFRVINLLKDRLNRLMENEFCD